MSEGRMRRAWITRGPVLWIAAVSASLPVRMVFAQDDGPLYHARLSDGGAVIGEPLRDWHDENATPRVGSHGLFDPNRPVQWLVRDAPPVPPTPSPFIEFVGGDRLPGEVIGYSSGSESRYRRVPAHLIVRPAIPFRRPNSADDPPLRIELKHVRHIAWEGHPTPSLTANTARLRDGRQLPFRALRWETHAVILLLEDGVETVPFHELAALRLPDGDTWDAYFDHAATLLPDAEGRLIQLETTGGLIALTSTQRLRPEAHGDNRRLEHWYQAVQPAWSLDPLWIPALSVATWRFFPPDRVPLTMLDPDVTREDVVFSVSRPPQVNRAVHGGALTDGRLLFGWGFGVHAPCRLRIPLPPQAVALRAAYALDPSVGSGGCVQLRAIVSTDAAASADAISADKQAPGDGESLLFESDLLIGSSPARGRGSLAFPEASDESARQLTLVADPVYSGRPESADPFDIRDAVNWLAPVVELDPALVKSELRRRAVSRLPGLAGWNVVPETSEWATVTGRWDTRDWEDPRFRSYAAVTAGYILMSRTLRIDDDDRYLAVFANCPLDEFRPARIQVRLDGVVLGEQAVPAEHGRGEPAPLLFTVDEFAGRTVTAEILQLPGAVDEPKPAAVDWRGAELVSHRPGLLRLFDDEAEFADLLSSSDDSTGDGSVTIDDVEPYSGNASLRIGSPGRHAASIPGWKHVVVEDPDLGEYRFLRFAWRGDGEGPTAVSLAHEDRFGPGNGVVVPVRQRRRPPPRTDDRGQRNGFRYLAGQRDTADAELSPAIVLAERPPEQWQVIQRDLYADFGPFTLTGLGVLTRNGALKLDDIYLARTRELFRSIDEDRNGPPKPQAGDGDVLLTSSDPRAFSPIVTPVAVGFGLSGQGGELQLLARYRGRETVLCTRPEGNDTRQAVRLTRAVELPAETESRLDFAVSRETPPEAEQASWKLQVFANGRELVSKVIDSATLDDEWLDMSVDLSEFAGRRVRLELRHQSGDGDRPAAYWHNVRIDSGQ